MNALLGEVFDDVLQDVIYGNDQERRDQCQGLHAVALLRVDLLAVLQLQRQLCLES